MAKAKAEMAKSKYPKGFKVTLLVGAGAQVEAAMGQILQSQLKQLGINVTFKQQDTSTEFQNIQKQNYQLGFSYWTMDIADPDELVTFAIDPKAGGAHSFYTDYNNPTVISLSHQAQRETNVAKRAQLYTKLQQIAAHDAFLGSSTTRRSARRTRASCTASSSSRSATTTWRTPGSASELGAGSRMRRRSAGMSLRAMSCRGACCSWCRSRSASRSSSSS